MDKQNNFSAAELHTGVSTFDGAVLVSFDPAMYPLGEFVFAWHSDFLYLLNVLPCEYRFNLLAGLEGYLSWTSFDYVYEFSRRLVPLIHAELLSDGVLEDWAGSLSPASFMYEYVHMVHHQMPDYLQYYDVLQVQEVVFVPVPSVLPRCTIRVLNTTRLKRKKLRLERVFDTPTVLATELRAKVKSVCKPAFVSVSHLVRDIFVRVQRRVKKETREPKRIWGAVQARAHRFASLVLTCQSGRVVESSKVARSERDEKQRQAAKAKAEEVRKSVPKAERKFKVLESRDKRSPVWKGYGDEELQSGRILPAILSAGGAVLAVEFWRTLRSGRKTSDAMSALLQQLGEFKSKLINVMGNTLWMIPFVTTVYYAINHFKVVDSVITGVVFSVCSTLVGAKLWRVVAKFFQDSSNSATGAIELQSGAFDVLPRLLSTVMCFSVFGRKFSPSTVTEFIKRLSHLDRLASGWDTFLRWVLESTEALVNFVRARFGADKIKLFNNVHKPTYEWASRVDKLVLEHSTADREVDAASLNEMVKLIREGHGFKELYRGTTMARYVDEYTMRASNLLQPYLGTINARNNFRFEPIACMLLGAPGIGKTIMAVPLCAAVLLESGLLPRDTTSDVVFENIWQKGTSEYWNSYASQLCLVMDDAFQQRADSTDKDNEYMNIIRMVGSWSFPLNFADLTSKGKIFFGSKFIFGTTNLRSFNAEAGLVIQEPQAVARRISFPYELRLKPEYSKDGRLDQEAYQRECARAAENGVGLDRYPWYIWEVARHDFIRGTTEANVIPLRELVIEMADALKARSSTFSSTKEFLSDFIAGMSKVESQSGRYVPNLDICLSSFKRHLSEWNSEQRQMSKKVTVWLKVLGVGIMAKVAFDIVRVLLSTVWKFFSGLFGGRKRAETQSNRPLARKVQRLKPRDVRLQATDTNVCTNVYGNTYKMVVLLDDDHEFVVGQVCFVEDTLVVQPEHFTYTLREMVNTKQIDVNNRVLFRHSLNEDHTFEISLQKYFGFSRVSDANADVEFLRFEDVRAHRNITGSFVREADLKYLGGVRARLDVCEVDDRKTRIAIPRRAVYTFPSLKAGRDLPVGRRRISRYFAYPAPTTQGDCGAPLCLFDNSSYSGRTAIGMHVGGSFERGLGFSNIITQEMIVDARKKLNTIVDEFETDLADRGVVLQSGCELPFTKKGSFLPIGTVDRAVITCPKSSYYPTVHFGELGEYESLPAPLSPVWRDGVLVYPMQNAVAPYSSPLYVYEQSWLRQAMHVAMAPLTSMTRDYSRRIYTFEEAVCGIPQEKFRSIPRGTAAGFPYVYDVRNGKKEFFGEGQEYDLTGKNALELRERVDYVIKKAKENVRLSHVFLDFLKDELRTPAKVQAVATRLISSAPLDYTIAWRMYFGAFSSAMMRHHTYTGMAPGICVYTEWDKLAEMLKKKGDKVFDGDFKGFDSSEQPTVHNLILQYVNDWYDDGVENARVRRVLFADLMHSRHIGGVGNDQRFIYQWNKSLPSGHPFTTIVNSMYSLFVLVGAYISATGDLTGFWNHVSSVTYGDDNVSNISDDVADRFNQVAVAAALRKEFSLVYTPGNKDGDFQPYTTLDDVTFLKRHIIDRDGWVCPLELDSFLYTCYWCKNRKLEDKIFHDVLEVALEELSMHDEATWAKYAPKLCSMLEKAGHVPAAPCDQNLYLAVVRSRNDNWY